MSRWWVLQFYETDPVFLLAWVFWIVASITLHELSHGWAAERLGDDTPRLLGHMTLNPLVHIPPIAWVVFAIFGMVWGSMPVNPSRLRGRHGDAIVALAGPAMNLSIALVMAVVSRAWAEIAPRVEDPSALATEPFHQNLRLFLETAVFLNLAMMLFNLIPVPPLDGSRILASYWGWYDRVLNGEQSMYLSLFGLALAGAFFWAVVAPVAAVLAVAIEALIGTLF